MGNISNTWELAGAELCQARLAETTSKLIHVILVGSVPYIFDSFWVLIWHNFILEW